MKTPSEIEREAESTEWCRDYGNVLALAHWLEADDVFDTREDVIYFFSKPWKWTTEFLAMKAGYTNLTAFESTTDAETEEK